jgi:hypothetical protein
MQQRLHGMATLLGVAGLIPFVVCGVLSLGQDTTYAHSMLWALLSYGAVILAFLGGVHWGFALEAGSEQSSRTERLRLLFGVLPALVGWLALLVSLVLPPWIGLLILAVGFLGTVLVEARASRHGLVPPRYMWLRWALSAAVLAMLVTVLTLRLLGLNIVA